MLPVLLLPASFHRIVKAINGAFPAVPSSALPRSKARISPWFGAELGLAHLGCSYTCFFPSLSDPCVLTAFRDLKTQRLCSGLQWWSDTSAAQPVPSPPLPSCSVQKRIGLEKEERSLFWGSPDRG